MSQIAMRWVSSSTAQLVFVLLTLAGCSTIDPYSSLPMSHNLQRDDDVGYCARLFADIDRRIDSLGMRDAEARRVAGFPYLRVDRFSVALAQRATNGPQERVWRSRLQQLDETARASELANAALTIDDLPRCRELLGAADSAAIQELRAWGKSAITGKHEGRPARIGPSPLWTGRTPSSPRELPP